jgi:hypothetical protein
MEIPMRRMLTLSAAIVIAGWSHLPPARAADVDGTKPAAGVGLPLPSAAAPAAPLLAQAASPGSGNQADMTPTEKAARSKLERAGYSQIRDIKSGPEGTTAKAVKDGKEVSVFVDTGGRIKERQAGQ